MKEDILGLDKIYLQGKRWTNPVSRPDIQAFVGSFGRL
ncbi:restriction endonuclease [Lysinibacillus sp. M3]|uniref:Restriction endonuclease n=1 Tax=Lysinibacillus zambalensis TaxID=3160866 RepID=A0ABV1MXU3_9BACI